MRKPFNKILKQLITYKHIFGMVMGVNMVNAVNKGGGAGGGSKQNFNLRLQSRY